MPATSFCNSESKTGMLRGGKGICKVTPKPLSENFSFGLGTPDPYETSAVLSQGGKELRAERLES